MNKIRVVKKEKIFCTVCEEEHEVDLCEELVETKIKGDSIKYFERFYRCNKYKTENTFITGKMWNNILLDQIDAYRSKNNLLTSFEIKEIRSKYKVTQRELAFMLGLGEITITRYETKQIQETSIDNMLKEVNNNAYLALSLLKKNKEKFSEKRYIEIITEIKNIVEKETVTYLNEQQIHCKYLDYSCKSEFNGNCVLNLEKLKNVLAYITKEMKEVKKVVLMKVLWYIDSLSYKYNDQAITGLVYRHMPFGALPICNDEMLNLPSINVEKIYNDEGYMEYKITNNPEFKITGLTRKEKEIIDQVISKFKDYGSREISDYMHKEKAYQETELEQIISFKYSKDLIAF